MTIINSVLGPLDTADIGFTLMHEHVIVASSGIPQDYPELLGDDRYERMIDELRSFKAGGVDTIVDASTVDLGRDVNLLVEASRKSGVNIVACAGWWLDLPPWFDGMAPDQLADVFVREIEVGVSGTNVKAGVLKSASDMGGVKPLEEVVLRGVARAHLKTGVPIMLHSCSPAQVGRRQIAVLQEEGVDLTRVKLDHSNDTTDVDYLIWILDQGCFLGLDRYPGRNISPEQRTHTMKILIDKGYADRLCPSHDGSILRVEVADPIFTTEERLARNPYGFLYIKKVVFPQLREMGVSEDVLSRLCVDGPRNFFEGKS